MGKSKRYTIEGELFETKALLQERIRTILYTYKDGRLLIPKDLSFMLAVLQNHPERDLKIGVGVKDIYIKQNPFYRNTRCFWLVRYDNSETDFSYTECLKRTSEYRKFQNACRAAVEPYTQEYKRRFFDNLKKEDIYFCPYTHEQLFFLRSHVDHKAPKTFKRLVENFINQNNIDIDQVQINSSSVDNSSQDLFEDKDFEKQWVEYHNTHAELQIVSQKANLSFPKKS